METKVDTRLTWLVERLGGTGDKLAILCTSVLHVGYFLVATLTVLFLSAPPFTRLVLIIVVPLNAWCEIRLGSSLSYASLTVLVTVALMGRLHSLKFERLGSAFLFLFFIFSRCCKSALLRRWLVASRQFWTLIGREYVCILCLCIILCDTR